MFSHFTAYDHGILYAAGGFALFALALAVGIASGRDGFDRTNSAGVMEFKNYRDYLAYEARQAAAQTLAFLLAIPGVLIFLYGVIMAAANR